MTNRSWVRVSALAGALLLSTSAFAGTVYIQTGLQNEGQGTFLGSFDYSASSASSATLTVTLKNTSPAANGGYITGFLFNNPGDRIAGATLTTGAPFVGLFGEDQLAAMPYGTFDLGAALGGSWTGGGSPVGGIAVGSTGTFVFTLAGTGLDTLTTQSFINEGSAKLGHGAHASVTDDFYGDQFIAVRFKGFANGASDKVLGELSGPGPLPSPSLPVPTVPLPGAAWSGLALMGLMGAGRMALRRKA